MLRVQLMQQWFGLSDPAMEEALWETPLLRGFAGIELGTETIPDETTILNFRHLLERQALGKALFDEMAALLTERGLLLREGTMVDATLIAAPPSTRNRERKRDPEMSQTKKGNQWHFGMKLHVGADAQSGLSHSADITTASVHDAVVTETLLHGAKKHRLWKIVAMRAPRGRLKPSARNMTSCGRCRSNAKKGEGLTHEQRRINRLVSSIRAPIEHVFRIIKRQFGYAKTRYRGLYKNGQQFFTLLALTNIFIARRDLRQSTA
jgi:transposase, IS5 family